LSASMMWSACSSVRGILFAILYQSLRSVRRIHAVLHAALGRRSG
jgi:hypothetical protein